MKTTISRGIESSKLLIPVAMRVSASVLPLVFFAGADVDLTVGGDLSGSSASLT
jgi:hypothetical protein